MMCRRAALALAGTVGLLVLFGVEPYKALIEERTGWHPSESPARALREDTPYNDTMAAPYNDTMAAPYNDTIAAPQTPAATSSADDSATPTAASPASERRLCDPANGNYYEYWYYGDGSGEDHPCRSTDGTWTTRTTTTSFYTTPPPDGSNPRCDGPSCEFISMQHMLNGTWRLSRGGYGVDEQATMTLYGPGRVVFQRLYTEIEYDYLQFGGSLGLSGRVAPPDICIPEGPQEVFWTSDGSWTMTRPGLSGWSFDFIPATAKQLKLKLRVKGKNMKAWMKVKVMNDGTEAKGEVKMTHRRRRRG